jgi:hypothetical protein
MIVRNNFLQCQGNEPQGFLNILWGHNTWWLLLYNGCINFVIANVFCKNVLCSAMYCPLSACFLSMCYVTCAFLSQDKIALVWLKKKQCTQVISQWITHIQLRRTHSCEKAEKRKCREPEVSVWLYIVKICSERRLCECSNCLTRQIFITKINVREEICYCINAYFNRVCENSTYLDNSDHLYLEFPLIL